MTQAHTPGPWTVQDTCREYNKELMIVAMQAGDNGTHVCQVTTSGRGNKKFITDEQDANAVLIAAAPDLLAALMDVYASIDDERLQSRALAAINKATGIQS